MPRREEVHREKIRQLYWDTYRSWVDRLEERHPSVYLFHGHPRGVPKSVCNFGGAGQLPSDQSGQVVAMGCQVECSDDHMCEIVKKNATADLVVGDKVLFGIPLSLSTDIEKSDEEDPECEVIPDGFIKPLLFQRQIAIPPRQPVHVDLRFAPAAESLIRRIESRVGPGSGWGQVTSYLLIDTTRSVF